LTGKIGKTTLGLVVANDQAPGKVDVGDRAYKQAAQFALARVKYDIYPASHLGLLATNREFLDSHSRLGGVDGSFQMGSNNLARFHLMATDHLDQLGVRRKGTLLDMRSRMDGRKVSYTFTTSRIDPDFRTDAGFVRRNDIWQTSGSFNYRWWPESWVINWGPRLNYDRNYNSKGVLQDSGPTVGLNVQFAKNIDANAQIARDLERFGGVDFHKTRYTFGGNINTSRRLSLGGTFNTGDQIRFIADPFLGKGADFSVKATLRPFSRLQSQISLDASRFVDPRTDTQVFDVKIYRALTTYQFTDRLLVRNITEHNTGNRTLAANLLLTYRVNAGTVFFVGYDDHFREGDQIDAVMFPSAGLRRTNRAIFTKFQFLFRR
jgi:hypothetical protein